VGVNAIAMRDHFGSGVSFGGGTREGIYLRLKLRRINPDRKPKLCITHL
jgi:hypothetical protein